MAYNKTTWQNGDTITAEKLNNMENGIADSPIFTVTITGSDNNYTSDKTYNEIEQAFLAGKLVRAVLGTSTYYLVNCSTIPGNDYIGALFYSFYYIEDSYEGESSEWSHILFVTISNQVVVKNTRIW